MGLGFLKKSTAAAAQASYPATPDDDDAPATKPAGTALGSKPQTQKKGLGFLKRGSDAQEELAKAEAAAEMAKAEAGKMLRFWMNDGEDRRITFLDGDLDENGMLDIPMYWEHTVKVNGKWQNFVCTEDNEGYCPLCAAGQNKALVGLMTVIDHTPYTIQNGPNAGKTRVHTRKVFAAKRNTIKQLNKLAVKRDGLAGCCFDVSRTGDKEPRVGNQFDFHTKYDAETLMAECDLKEEDLEPANYEEEIVYHSQDELVALGLGNAPEGPGYQKKATGAASKKLASQL